MNRAEQLIRTWFAGVWSPEPRYQVELIDELLHPNFRQVGIGSDRSRADFRRMHGQVTSRIPDIRIEVMESWPIGEDAVAHHSLARGTHVDGAAIEFTGTGFVRLEGETIIETRESWDLLGLMVQIGMITPEVIALEITGG